MLEGQIFQYRSSPNRFGFAPTCPAGEERIFKRFYPVTFLVSIVP